MLKFLKNQKRLILINISVLSILIFSPSLLLFSYRKVRSLVSRNEKISLVDPRAHYPTYPSKKIGNEIYLDLQSLQKKYRAFLGWINMKKKSKHINIMGIYNTRYSSGQKLENSIWFFGGSTMWGTGVSDRGTIPSNYYRITKNSVLNFGVGGYNSRHSLNQLISVLGDGYRPSKVVFYDGYNEILGGCRTENKLIPTHTREKKINDALLNNREGLFSMTNNYLLKISEILVEPFTLLNQEDKKSKNLILGYDCNKNNDKALKVAKNLVNNWYTAYVITRNENISFYAILHPTIFSSDASYEFFTEEWKNRVKHLTPQFDVVYPLIKEALRQKCIEDDSFCRVFYDGSNWIPAKTKVFIDDTHLNNEGNLIIAEKLKLIIDN